MEGYLCRQDKPACALVEAKNDAVWTTVTILRSLSFQIETFVELSCELDAGTLTKNPRRCTLPHLDEKLMGPHTRVRVDVPIFN